MNPFKKALNKESTAGIIFTLPFTIGFLLFMIVPMGISLYYSFSLIMTFFHRQYLPDWIIL